MTNESPHMSNDSDGRIGGKMSRKINIVVTGVGGGGFGQQIMKTLRLSTLNCRVIATDVTKGSYGLSDADKHCVVPRADDKDYVSTILDICRKEKAEFLIAGSEPELLRLVGSIDMMQENNVILLANSFDVVELCMDKYRLFKKLQRLVSHFPRFKLITDPQHDVEEIDYPAVVKPIKGSGGSNMVFLALNRKELLFFSEYLTTYGYQPLIQEYVGTPEDEYTIGVLSSSEAEILGSIALRRYLNSAMSRRIAVTDKQGRKFVVSSGISQGEVREFASIREQAEEIASALGSKGPLNIQGRTVDGIFYPFEINPRFSGTTPIRAMLGWNEPEILIRYCLYNEKPIPIHRFGTVLRDVSEKLIPE